MARTKQTARKLTPEQIREREDRAAAALSKRKRSSKRALKVVKTTPLVRKSTLSAAGGIKKPHRFRAGTVAGREVTKLQKTTNTLVPKASFLRVVRENIDGQQTDVYRISEDAKEALQQASEDYLTEVFRASDLVRSGAGPHPMDTLMVRHMRVANDVAAIYPGNNATDHSIQRRQVLQEEYDRQRAERRAKTEARKAKATLRAKKVIAEADKRRQADAAEDAEDDDETTVDDREEEEEEEEEAAVEKPAPRAFVLKGKKPRRNVDSVPQQAIAVGGGGDAM